MHLSFPAAVKEETIPPNSHRLSMSSKYFTKDNAIYFPEPHILFICMSSAIIINHKATKIDRTWRKVQMGLNYILHFQPVAVFTWYCYQIATGNKLYIIVFLSYIYVCVCTRFRALPGFALSFIEWSTGVISILMNTYSLLIITFFVNWLCKLKNEMSSP